MPTSLARKLLICAAVDGLIIQPLTPKGQRPVKIKYGEEASLATISRDQLPDISRPNSSFEAFGVIGLFTVSRLSYLITITGRQQVAQIRGYPVYVVTDVALTPCISQSGAESAVRHTAIQLRRAASSNNKIFGETASESETDDDVASVIGHEDADDVESDRGSVSGKELAVGADDAKSKDKQTSIAQDVLRHKGSYGRFAQRWFSRKGWVEDQKRNMGISDMADDGPTDDASKKDKMLSNTVVAETASSGVTAAVSTGESLLPKMLRMAHIWFGTSRSFYFSYDVDITRNLASGGIKEEETSLHRVADPLFFWNSHLLRPFSTLSEDGLLLPIMQGFVGQREFVVDRHPPQIDSDKGPDSMELNDLTPNTSPPSEENEPDGKSFFGLLRPSEKKFVITVISRRSIRRAGLRYLRRGIDDHGYTANGVETEQLLSTPAWDDSNIFSFLQCRGSIPLFFTQTPYSLKPVPELQHSEAVNFKAFTRHFEQMKKRYGSMQLVNLVEKHGVEASIGNSYEQNVEMYNKELAVGGESLIFEWFDFHAACRGMKFENVSLLIDKLGSRIEEWRSTVETKGEIFRRQKGVLRTNCMDCLDRTNVCQSSFGKHMLDLQLKEEGFDMSAQLDQETSWFNTLWADNGDAISKQYASTAAMKGDYTRTRKRDYRGMVNDLGLSLTRFYNGMVNDYFSQAAIDFLLGNVTSMVFEEFEATMMTKDPAVSMARMREQAIDTSRKIVVENDSEDFIGGWTLLSPHDSNAVKSLPFEEVVLLLTDGALYLCRFDWKLDKVSSFERVDLAHVVSIKVGTYITSTISTTQIDESKNVGLVITYEPGKNDVKRVNTRSISSITKSGNKNGQETNATNQLSGILAPIFGASPKKQRPVQKTIALKAPYAQSSMVSRAKCDVNDNMTELEQINVIVAEIERLVFVNQPVAASGAERKSIIERGDIISLADARKNTTLLDQLGYSIKRLVWA